MYLFCSVLSHPRFEGRPHHEQYSSNVSCLLSVLSFPPLSIPSIPLCCPTSLFSVFLFCVLQHPLICPHFHPRYIHDQSQSLRHFISNASIRLSSSLLSVQLSQPL